MQQEIRFCTSADGVRLAYATSGTGPPLVLSSTWLTHLEHQWRSLAWQPWLTALSRAHTLLRYDSRGCGLSERDVERLCFESWVNDLEAVADAAGFGRFALLGTCWGGPVAIAYAARHPERVSRLVLYGTYARGRLRRADLPQQIDKGRLLLELTELGWGIDNHAFQQVWALQFQPGGSLEHLRSWSEQQRLATSAGTAVRLMQSSWNVDVTLDARRIRCPVLVIHAERDAVVPLAEAQRLASLIPDSRFVLLDSENHMPLDSEPGWPQLMQLVHSFLAEPEPAAARASPRWTLAELTQRERAVLEGIARGQDNAQIAASLGIAEKTVRNHVTHVFDKIGAAQRYEAIVMARDAGLGRPAAARSES